ncbi:hypothetical protein NMG60_11004592 [Bertholletia excelsa]
MDAKGGCCIARYAGAGAYDMSRVDRILLRFRPIAPKPASSGSASGGSAPDKSDVSFRSGRGKRRYNSSNKRCGSRKRKSSSEETDSVHKTSSGESVSPDPVVTLPLLPEIPDRKASPAGESPTHITKQAQNKPIWLDFSKNNNHDFTHAGHVSPGLDQTVVMLPQGQRQLGCVVTVECVTDTWVEGYELGRTDGEMVGNLMRDACPAFVSDGLDRVRWSNAAFREMVGAGQGEEVGVWLVVKEALAFACLAFTCRVRMEFNGRSLTAPCDVWKMDGGGFAWRLDVKAALSLGR